VHPGFFAFEGVVVGKWVFFLLCVDFFVQDNHFFVFVVGFKLIIRHQHRAIRDPNNLSLQQVLLLSIKLGEGPNIRLHIPCEIVLNLSCLQYMPWGDQRQLHPVREQIVGHPVGQLIYS